MKLYKRIITIYLFIICISTQVISGQNLIEQANEAYKAGDFTKSINLFETELKNKKQEGLESAQLYYNLGNSYFRSGDEAKALLNYERALLLDPGDRDIRHNIQYAKTQIEDKILEVDSLFIESWFIGIQNLFSSNTWANISIFLFMILISSFMTFIFSKTSNLKKLGFYVAITILPLLIITNIYSYDQKYKITNRNTAIIMSGSAPIMSSPDINSKELFILHSGTKVKINKEDKNWLEIEIDNGDIGWINRDKLEII